MIGNGFQWKGENLMHTESDFRIGISNVDRRTIKVVDDKIDLIGKHGSITGPTYARGRSITIDGYIIATTRLKLSKGMDWVDRLFGLQGQLGVLELYDLVIVDEQGREWTTKCKVETPPQYSIEEDNDHNDGAFRRFRISLYAPDPAFYSTETKEVLGSEGDIGGFMFGEEGFVFGLDGIPFYSISGEIIIVSGVSSSPLHITIDVAGEINSPLMIENIGTGAIFYLDIIASSGDRIEIDSVNRRVYKNGINVTSLRMPGSSRPYTFGVTQLVIHDIDGGLLESDFDVTIKYNESLL